MDNFKKEIEDIDISNVTSHQISVIEEVIRLLDTGKIRVAEPSGNDWIVNEWVKNSHTPLFLN